MFTSSACVWLFMVVSSGNVMPLYHFSCNKQSRFITSGVRHHVFILNHQVIQLRLRSNSSCKTVVCFDRRSTGVASLVWRGYHPFHRPYICRRGWYKPNPSQQQGISFACKHAGRKRLILERKFRSWFSERTTTDLISATGVNSAKKWEGHLITAMAGIFAAKTIAWRRAY